SFYRDSERRSLDLERAGLNFLGVGISGGEEGALWGPSIMPGGHPQAYAMIQPVFTAIAAKVDGDPCVTYIGERGSGHFVKMVHNGIEYGDMQLIAEAYDLLRRGAGLGAHELGEVFARWNRGPLASFLIEITAQIFSVQDAATGAPLVELVRDEAQQKGTGKWASQEALDLGVPIPTLTAAVEARSLSAFRAERRQAAEAFPGETGRISGEVRAWIDAVEKALYAAKICAYAQGMRLLMAADQAYGYGLNYAEIARIWRGGCIIRARLLNEVRNAYFQDASLANLFLAPFFRQALAENQAAWRKVVQQAAALGIPTPAMSASLAYFDSFRSPRLPANLIQAQRDLFGAHTYRRVDKDGDFHSDWSPGN
ncbi:MAG: NADP-dependent phosphogluconate dehydrogenase, partial [Anaerolineales bacterium]|nr:NADP-dependent phosphogluconate dehydrogenase [Anaerolineales bacterium]